MTEASPLRIRDFEGSALEWDQAAIQLPGFTHCHLAGWRDVFHATFDHESVSLIAERADGGIEGVLPLIRVKGPFFGDFLVSMPFLNYGGPIGSAAAVEALAAEAVARATSSNVDLLELRCRAPQPIALSASLRKVTVILPLPKDPDVLMKSFEAKLRSQVRKPQKEGVEVRAGSDQLDHFFAVFAEHMRDLGTPVLPRRLFAHFLDRFGDDALLLVARLNGKPIAAGCGIFAGGEFEMIWASALHAYSKAAPNMLVYWRAMEMAIARGVGSFNFGRCSVGAGTHRFKRQWTGAVDEQLHWYQYGAGAAKTPSPDDGKYSWGPRLWKKLPLPIANLLGPHIIRGIP